MEFKERKLRYILDKLTPQNFKESVEELKKMIDTLQELESTVNFIYEKAIEEPDSCVLCANMCKHLAFVKVPLDNGQGVINLRKMMVTKCQKEFENDELTSRVQKLVDKEEKVERMLSVLEEYKEEKRMQRRKLGNIRLLGECFKLNMPFEPIMHDCIQKLLAQGDEESLECLCCLFKSIGKELDERGGKSQKNGLMESYFTDMQRIVDNCLTSSRVRPMLQDVVDLRKNNWIPSGCENSLKTIAKIHKGTENEAYAIQKDCQNINCSKHHPDGRRKVSGFEKLKQDFKEILLNGTLSNVILNVADKEFKAHRCVLAARSPVFLAMMTQDTKEKKSGVVDITDVDPTVFSDFLNYLYTGSIENLTSEKALKLSVIADKYQVNELKEICLDHKCDKHFHRQLL